MYSTVVIEGEDKDWLLCKKDQNYQLSERKLDWMSIVSLEIGI